MGNGAIRRLPPLATGVHRCIDDANQMDPIYASEKQNFHPNAIYADALRPPAASPLRAPDERLRTVRPRAPRAECRSGGELAEGPRRCSEDPLICKGCRGARGSSPGALPSAAPPPRAPLTALVRCRAGGASPTPREHSARPVDRWILSPSERQSEQTYGSKSAASVLAFWGRAGSRDSSARTPSPGHEE